MPTQAAARPARRSVTRSRAESSTLRDSSRARRTAPVVLLDLDQSPVQDCVSAFERMASRLSTGYGAESLADDGGPVDPYFENELLALQDRRIVRDLRSANWRSTAANTLAV
jgi:hypothetical protein